MQTRKSSRAIVLNEKNEIYLFQYNFVIFVGDPQIWITPGGGLEEGESFDDALKREVYEELGVQLSQPAKQIYYRDPIYTYKDGKQLHSEERFYVVRLEEQEFHYEHWTEEEQQHMKKGKWWSAEEIMKSKEEFFSTDLVKILNDLADGRVPDEPVEIA